MDWRLALTALAVMPLLLLTTRRLGGRIRRVARQQRQRGGEVSATAAEVIGSIKVVQSMSLEDMHHGTFAARNSADLGEGVKAKRLSAKLMSISDVLIAISTALVLWFGARLVTRGALTPGDLIVFLSYLKSALRPLRDVARYSGRIAKAAASAERIVEVLDTTPLIRNRPDAVPVPRPIESVRFEGVSFAYDEGRSAVSDLSFEISKGRMLALAGASGAGKSTVVNLLLRLWDPDQGVVSIDGRDLRDYRVESLRPAIAVVPQENVLFRVSVRDNIAYGAPAAGEEQIIEAARLARAHEFICALPEGYDTVVGERGQLLSEGQRQRIAIARAVVRAAPILVLDEATSSLDLENSRMIREALRELRAGRITLLVAHDLTTVQEADQILFLDAGRIVERGTHAELLESGGRYAAAFHLQRGLDPAATGAPRVVRA
ncbi:MAG TPA: ABC transporter ATP-binding protein, partial [Planctomycetota bacterium]|nr:ABC transporter ATP-binding protein [Planctomycetota bacterium]